METNAVQEVKPNSSKVVPAETKQVLANLSGGSISIFDTERMDKVYAFAVKISASTLVPDHYQNNPPNCFLAMWKAERMGMDFHSFMQVSYVYKGKFGYEAKFVIARLNTSGKFNGPVRWKTEGEIKRNKDGVVTMESTKKWIAYATYMETGEMIDQSFELTTAIRNGWTKEATSKWNTMTEEKGQYQSAIFLGRMYAPEVIMDMQTREEVEDVKDAEVINQTETGKNIFEKGEDVSTEPDPVLDPSKEIKQPAMPKPVETAVAPTPAIVVPASNEPVAQGLVSEATKTPAPAAAPIEPEESLPAEPPVEPAPFKDWLLKKFARESTEIDCCLLSKAWLRTGETLADLNESKLRALRDQWSKFLVFYTKFKAARKV